MTYLFAIFNFMLLYYPTPKFLNHLNFQKIKGDKITTSKRFKLHLARSMWSRGVYLPSTIIIIIIWGWNKKCRHYFSSKNPWKLFNHEMIANTSFEFNAFLINTSLFNTITYLPQDASCLCWPAWWQSGLRSCWSGWPPGSWHQQNTLLYEY